MREADETALHGVIPYDSCVRCHCPIGINKLRLVDLGSPPAGRSLLHPGVTAKLGAPVLKEAAKVRPDPGVARRLSQVDKAGSAYHG